MNLFDLDLARQVVGLDSPGLAQFLAQRGAEFAERDRRFGKEDDEALIASLPAARDNFARFFFQLGGPPAEPDPENVERTIAAIRDRSGIRQAERWSEFADVLRDGGDLDEVRRDVAWTAATMSRDLPLDYWGCFHIAASGLEIERSVETTHVLWPDEEEGDVYFLQARHVDVMIASLRAHWPQVTVMEDADLQRLVDYRNRCAAEPGLRLAYHTDY